MNILEKIDGYLNEEKITNHELLHIKKIFRQFFTDDLNEHILNKKSFVVAFKDSRRLKVALRYKFVTKSTKVPKDMFGFDDMKEEGKVFAYPTKKGLQLMIAMQKHNDLPKNKIIKL